MSRIRSVTKSGIKPKNKTFYNISYKYKMWWLHSFSVSEFITAIFAAQNQQVKYEYENTFKKENSQSPYLQIGNLT